jgi:hypothetical protein
VSKELSNNEMNIRVITETGATLYSVKTSPDLTPKDIDAWVPIYDPLNPKNVLGNVLLVNKKRELMVIDTTGRKIVTPRYVALDEPFAEGLIAVSELAAPRGKCGYADRSYQLTIPVAYDSCDVFSDGLAAVTVGRSSGYIDHSGKVQIAVDLSVACRFSDGLAKVQQNGKWAFIDKRGKTVFETSVTGCQIFSESRVPANQGRLWGFADTTGKLAIPPAYFIIGEFHDGRAFVRDNQRTKLIDLQGTEIPLSQLVEGSENFEKGLARVKVGGDWGLMDTSGRMVVKAEYRQIRPLVSGLRSAVAFNDPRFDYFDAKGAPVKPPNPLCTDYRAGVFTCIDVKKEELPGALLKLMFGSTDGTRMSYITRAGTRIGGIDVSENK